MSLKSLNAQMLLFQQENVLLKNEISSWAWAITSHLQLLACSFAGCHCSLCYPGADSLVLFLCFSSYSWQRSSDLWWLTDLVTLVSGVCCILEVLFSMPGDSIASGDWKANWSDEPLPVTSAVSGVWTGRPFWSGFRSTASGAWCLAVAPGTRPLAVSSDWKVHWSCLLCFWCLLSVDALIWTPDEQWHQKCSLDLKILQDLALVNEQ